MEVEQLAKVDVGIISEEERKLQENG